MIGRIVLAVAVLAGSVFAQGPLAPPGAPGPTFRTLTQVEPRWPISSVPTSLTVRGSYYLTTNLTGVASANGITLSTSDITIDLNGFSLVGVASSLEGIFGGGVENIVIKNGTIRGWDGGGVNMNAVSGGACSDLIISDNGDEGLIAGDHFGIQGCTFRQNDETGLYIAGEGCVIEDCVSSDNDNNGFDLSNAAVVRHCAATGNKNVGFSSASGCRFESCTALSNYRGYFLGANNSVQGCMASFNTNNGITAGSASIIEGNVCYFNGSGGNIGAGIAINGEQARVVRNVVNGNDFGLQCSSFSSGNVIEDNVVLNNSDNYDLTASNSLKLIIGELPESIDWPAHVELAGTLTGTSGTNGLTVTSGNVTVDLGGHALLGVGGSANGIAFNSATNVTVRNGILRNWGLDGINASAVINGHFHDLTVENNGAAGLSAGRRCIVTEVLAGDNFLDGIYALDAAIVTRCVAYSNGVEGIDVDFQSIVKDCVVTANENGITASGGTQIRDCVARNNAGSGIRDSADCNIRGNVAASNGTGIQVTAGDNRIEENTMSDNGTGLRLESGVTGNFIVKNTASGNATNYGIISANAVGPIDNVAGQTITNLNPWTNFEF